MDSKHLSRSVVLALILALVTLVFWEMYWRSEGFPPAPDDNRHFWAVQRAKVNSLGADDYVFIGSSRILFDLQLDEWEKVTGKRPVQLGIAGGSPNPVFDDIVNNSEYNGTISHWYNTGPFLPWRPTWYRLLGSSGQLGRALSRPDLCTKVQPLGWNAGTNDVGVSRKR